MKIFFFVAMGAKIDETMCSGITRLGMSQHPEDVREGAGTSVGHFYMRSHRNISLHRWNDRKNAHTRNFEGKRNPMMKHWFTLYMN